MALQEAKIQVTHAKINVFGGTGSGKTVTDSLLALGLSIERHNRAPVAFYSTEPGVDYVIPIFEKEGVKLYVERSKSFSDLMSTTKQLDKLGCCALIVDSITHVWKELVDAYCRRKEISKPEFHHWKEIKGDDNGWGTWSNWFVNSRVHILTSGRAGYEYEYEEDESGKKSLVKGDSKMKAEGEFGYEADLLIEMSAASDKAAQRKARTRSRKAQAPDDGSAARMVHNALIRKCRVWDLNGKQFQFVDRDTYNKGDYKLVYDPFKPFFNYLASGTPSGPVVDDSHNSDARFEGPDWSGKNRKVRREAAFEEIKGSLGCVFTAATGKDATFKTEIINEIFGTHSWSAVERLAPEDLEYGASVCIRIKHLCLTNEPKDRDSLINVVKQAKAEIHDEAANPPTDTDCPDCRRMRAKCFSCLAQEKQTQQPEQEAMPF